MTEKTEDQIAKEKEAVKAMTGAKDAMIQSLNRIQTLEATLKSVRAQAERVGKAFGDDVFLNVYQPTGSYAPERASKLFQDIDNKIKAAL